VFKGKTMNEQPIEAFIKLVSFDQRLVVLDHEIRELKKSLQDLVQGARKAAENLTSLERQVRDQTNVVRAQELRMKEIDQRESDVKKHLKTVGSPREYDALKRELLQINDQQQACEKEVVEAWGVLEGITKKLHEQKSHALSSGPAAQEHMNVLEQKIESLTELYKKTRDERVFLLSAVPQDVVNNYEHMRGNVDNPVVPVVSDVCSACFYSIPKQDLSQLQRGGIVPCKNCYRLVYFAQE